MELLREGLLDGTSVALAGAVAEAVREEVARLGATVSADGVQALVYDASEAFAEHGLQAALQSTWEAIEPIANGSLIAGGGKIVLVAPRPDAGVYAEAARSALENLARTLSVEWARYRVTVTAIAPGPGTTDTELATLVCYLLSRAGDYLSGCRFDLHG